VSGSADPGRLAILAHEIKSPVAALVAIADAYPTADAGRRRRLLELANAALEGIDRLLADAATASVRLERVDASRLASDAAETAALAGHPVAAETHHGMAVEGDRERLRQALDNLIENALGHSPPDGVVTVSVGRRDASVVIAVTDEGEGIAADDLGRVFEPGVRLTSSRPGSGLGLAVVRAIAEAHGGEVEVESTVGVGTTLRLVLPGASGGY
jgi:two-component system sensor histidine kinase BaeS